MPADVVNDIISRLPETEIDTSNNERIQGYLKTLDSLGRSNIKYGHSKQRSAQAPHMNEPVAIERIHDGSFHPCHVMSHNDLWAGNILIDHRGVTGSRAGGPGRRFVIIDWPGATLRGFAIVDLVRFARAIPLGRRRFRREVTRHCRILECEFQDAMSHLLAGMGNILKHREHFPLPLFIATSEDCLALLKSIGP